MKLLFKFIIASCLVLISVNRSAAQRSCGSESLYNEMLNSNPKLKANKLQRENNLQQLISARVANGNNATSSVISIPVVVHVIHHGEATGVGANVSDARIQQQIDILNTAFAGLNSDSLTPSHPFYPYVGKSSIQFCLAKTDPYGYATTGITRTASPVNAFFKSFDAYIKSTQKGGKNGWDNSQYLNIWIVTIGGTELGWAYYPDIAYYIPEQDGIVIGNKSLGISPDNFPDCNDGNTLVHEAGHWLNLIHTWGPEANSVCGDDQVTDTPTSQGPNYGCPSFPCRPNNSCGSGANGEMYMNYMDYSSDQCMRMFSKGQVTRMEAAFSLYRSSLLSSQGCQVSVINKPFLAASRWYVNPSSTGNGNGTSWTNAIHSLSEALFYAKDYGVTEIWVKKGVYKPSESGNQWKLFYIPSGMKIYGGFNGNELTLNQRDYNVLHTTNETTISGDLSGNDVGFTNNSENSFQLIRFYIADTNTVLDGFTVKGGNASNPAVPFNTGGGLINYSAGLVSEPRVRNCIFKYNTANQGGAVYIDAAWNGRTNMKFENCEFQNNYGTTAGAVYLDGSSGENNPVFYNTKFIDNNCNSNGGAIGTWANGDGGTIGECSPEFYNCEFIHNGSDTLANTFGGCYYNQTDALGIASPKFANCVFRNNYSNFRASVFTSYVSDNGISQPEFNNCSIFRNTSKTTWT
ncbi:MAG TPA: zinc metalloprotease, partial [Bacteroidia bacterium]